MVWKAAELKAEILRRMRSDWETQATIDPKAASLLGAVAGGAVSGIAADIATGGATLGLGALGGAIVGALGGAGAAAAYNVQKGHKENIITWSPASMEAIPSGYRSSLFGRCALRPRQRSMGRQRISGFLEETGRRYH